ncbi:S-layer homology domain-containing protein [Thermaerobacter subterraneus]|nr:S-layer homology domain-containing protein [Thermaerobacter subterraneus]
MSVISILVVALNVAIPMAFAEEVAPPTNLLVRVVDADGQGRPEVPVRLGEGWVNPGTTAQAVQEATTNDEGLVVFENIAGDAYWVAATDTNLGLTAGKNVWLDLDEGNEVVLVLDSAKKAGIEGEIDGSATLTVSDGSYWWSTNDISSYSIELQTLAENRVYEYRVEYGTTIYTRIIGLHDQDIVAMPTVYAKEGVAGCSDINATVAIPSGFKSSGVVVELWPVNTSSASPCHNLAASGDDGILDAGTWSGSVDPSSHRVVLNGLAPGMYAAIVRTQDSESPWWSDVLTDGVNLAEGQNEVSLEVPQPATVKGVAMIAGQPAVERQIYVLERFDRFGIGVSYAQTDDNGAFEMTVPQGNLEICIQAAGCQSLTVTGDQAGQVVDLGEVDLTGEEGRQPLPPGDRSLTVDVKDGLGKPVGGAGVLVEYWLPDEERWIVAEEATTGDHGRAIFNDLPQGRYWISVDQDGDWANGLGFEQELWIDEDEQVEVVVDENIPEGKDGVQGEIGLGFAEYSGSILFTPLDESADGLIRRWWFAVDYATEPALYSVLLPEGRYDVEFLYYRDDQGWIQSIGGQLDVDGTVTLPELYPWDDQCLTTSGQVTGAQPWSDPPVSNVWMADWVRMEFVRGLEGDGGQETPCDWIVDTLDEPYWQAPVWYPGDVGEWRLNGLPRGRYMVFTDPYKLLDDGDYISYTYFDYLDLMDPVEGFDLELREPARVTGRVVQEDGAPVQGAGVEIWPDIDEPWVRTQTTYTDEEGQFTLYTMPGSFYLQLEDETPLGEVFSVGWGDDVDLGNLTRAVTDTEPEPEPEPSPTPQPGPGPQPSPAPAPAPAPAPGTGSDEVTLLEPDRVAEVIDTPGTEVSFEIPADQPVVIPSNVVELLASSGKEAVRFDYGAVEVNLPVANLDRGQLAELNPYLAAIAGNANAQIRFTVKETEPARLPAGFAAAGGLYEIKLEVAVPDSEPVAVSKLPEPVTITVPITWTGDPVVVGLWYQKDDGSLVPVPSWPSGEQGLTAALRHFSRYVVAARQSSFTDVKGHWARRNIEAAYAHGIINGFDASTFGPDRAVNRIQFVAMLTRALGLEPDAQAAQRFKDLSPAWEGVAGAAYKAGIVRGVSASQFEPNRQMSRLELAVMIGRALKTHGFSLSEAEVAEILSRFKDGSAVPMWAREAVATAVKAGVVRGVRRDELVLDRTATRAETASIVVRFLEAWLREDQQ